MSATIAIPRISPVTLSFSGVETKRESVAVPYRHQPGAFCLGVALRGVMEAEGVKLSEAETMGLGVGVCLRYGADLARRAFHLEVCHSGIDLALFANTGILCRQRRTLDPDVAEARLLEMLAEGRPVALKVSPRFCPGVMNHTPPELVPLLYIHWIVVSAYDAETDAFTYHDNTRFAAWSIGRTELREARCATGPDVQNGRNVWLEPERAESLVPAEVGFAQAIRQMVVASRYLHRGDGYKGSDAATRFARHVKSWRTTQTPDEIRGNALAMMSSLTLGGSLKGAGRRHYADFLASAARRLQHSAFAEAAAPYRELARTWTALYDRFAEMAADPTDERPFARGSELFRLLDAMADGERAAAEGLEAALDELDRGRALRPLILGRNRCRS
jgi:hypothetical protein